MTGGCCHVFIRRGVQSTGGHGKFLWYLAFGSVFIGRLFPGVMGYLGVFCLVVGNFGFLYLMMLSGLVREDYDLMKVGLLAPLSWFLMSLAAWQALWELVVNPHFWQKTRHGLIPQTLAPAPDPLPTDWAYPRTFSHHAC